MGRGTRTRIAKGIFEDLIGLAAVVAVRGRSREKRYPKGTSLKEIRRWQTDTRSALERLRTPTKRGTLAAEVERFLAQHKHLKAWRSRKIELGHWTARYGSWSRWKIGHAQVLEARVAWLAQNKSPKTVNNRVAALAALYHALDGRKAPTPCDEIDPLPWTPPPPRVVGPETIMEVWQRLKAYTRLKHHRHLARFMVLASTGVRPCEVMRAQPGDIDETRRVWRTRDAKGGYRPGGLYLNDDMLIAWQFFAKVEAWGEYNTQTMADVLRSCGWPKSIRPYQLRHTLGITLSEAGIDLKDVADWLGQTNDRVTRRHYVPVLGSRMETASKILKGRFDWEPPAAVKSVAPISGNARKSRQANS